MADPRSTATREDHDESLIDRHRRRGPTDPSMLSTKRSFPITVGRSIIPGELAGYYVDLSFKAATPAWPPPGWSKVAHQFHVATAQWGLGALERHLQKEEGDWLAAAARAGEALLDDQLADGSWPHQVDMMHTYRLRAPWLSAMAQGEGASLLVRLYSHLGDERYAEAALAALRPFAVPVAEGGVRARLGDGPFFEEYPTETASLVLNGGIFALWGAYDVALALDDAAARRDFDDGVEAIASEIHRYDNGYWSLYDLFPHPIPNISSSAYHALHINQLEAMQIIAPRPQLRVALERFRAYEARRINGARAFASKVAFRLAVPRNALLAHRLPWSSA